MRWQLALISASVLIFIINAAPFKSSIQQAPKVIYGEDNRKEYFEVDDANVLAMADSTVALFPNTRLETQGYVTKLLTIPFGPNKNLCPSEPYYSQEMGAACTGFLVAPDIVVSAGHCISSKLACERNKIVFGFKLNPDGSTPRTVPTSDIYGCKEVIYTIVQPHGPMFPNDAMDFSIVRLDRPVVGHAPLDLRLQGEAQVGDDLLVIGHPASLPVKIADGAKIREMRSKFFFANLDTYAGNSGSPVINAQTHEVEGVLVRGENDFILKDGCLISNRCPDSGCRGEEVTKIKSVLSRLRIAR